MDGDCGHTIIPKHLVPNRHHHGTVGQPSSGSASTMGAMPAPSTMTSVDSSAKSPWFQGYSTLSTFQFMSLHVTSWSTALLPLQTFAIPQGPRAPCQHKPGQKVMEEMKVSKSLHHLPHCNQDWYQARNAGATFDPHSLNT